MTQKIICVDANLVVKLVSSPPSVSIYVDLWQHWQNEGCQIVAPTLFCYEISNALHRMSLVGILALEEATQALEDAFSLDVILYGNIALHWRAIEIARSLNLSATYDAHYLALAEQLNSEFYTADRRLFNSVQMAFSWIHLVS